ncbi:MAG TPA: ABC transporter ATP-binding protein [Planctomycetes bacterium]|nr:ABC transporter ATP-binding protein [Planctomycetota bacterium]HIL52577.1 ABC transporter ATP-binding protein [Planctomycetota bacterium]
MAPALGAVPGHSGGSTASAGVAPAVLLRMAQVIPRATAKHRTAAAVDAGQLKIDQVRKAVGAHQDVLFLVQVVVAHTAAVQVLHQIVEMLKEITGQALGEVQGLARDPFAQEHLTARRRARLRCGSELRCARSARQGGEGFAFTAQEPTGHQSRGGQSSPAGHPAERQTSGAPHKLDAAQAVALQFLLHLPLIHLLPLIHAGRLPLILAGPILRRRSRVSRRESPMLAKPPDPGADLGCIRVLGLTRSFDGKRALAPLDIDIGPGGIVGLLGPNGSGKSTFLRCLVGLVPPDGGTVRIDGADLVGDGLAIRRRVSYSPGELAVYGELRGEAHLAWLLAGRDAETLGRGRALALEFGLPLKSRLRTYSHGMKRQLYFAAVMAPRVRVRLLDEITEGLDPSKRNRVHELLREDADAGTTILLSSHNLGEVRRVCDSMIFMRAGEVLSKESADAVQRRSRSLLRLTYGAHDDFAAIEQVARASGVRDARRRGGRLTLQLDCEDPRAVLAAVCSASQLPKPQRVEYGELSLEDLYRELYDAEVS